MCCIGDADVISAIPYLTVDLAICCHIKIADVFCCDRVFLFSAAANE